MRVSDEVENTANGGAVPAYRIVFEMIEREILEGALRVGDRLPTETDLAARFGLHRSTTREGLRLLEESGLVVRGEGRRLYAAAPRASDVSVRARRALVLQGVTFDQLWRLLSVLEPAAASEAAAVITDEDCDALERNLEQMKAAAAEGRSIAKLDMEFHSLIAEATRNGAWLLAREPAAALAYSADERMLPLVPQSSARQVAAHEEILAALKARDGARAAAWMRRHIDDFRRGYELAQLDMHQPIGLPRGVAAPAEGRD